jgi:hypothetical protein
MRDPIVEEVREARRRLAEKCGHDLKKIVAYIRKREQENGRKVVDLSAKRAQV